MAVNKKLVQLKVNLNAKAPVFTKAEIALAPFAISSVKSLVVRFPFLLTHSKTQGESN